MVTVKENRIEIRIFAGSGIPIIEWRPDVVG